MDMTDSKVQLLPIQRHEMMFLRTPSLYWRSGTAALAAFALAALTSTAAGADANVKSLKSAELFNPTKVWTIHLKIAPDQWAAMEPQGGGGGFFGGPGRGGPGGRGGGGFGPGNFMAPAFMAQGDADKDSKLSQTEFVSMGEKWFDAWDKDKAGKVNEDKMRDGLNATLQGGPGGPGGRRGGGPGLQGAEGKRNGLASAAGVEFKYGRADMEFEGQTFSDVAVRYKGNGTFMGSRESLKKSLKIHLSEFKKGQKLGEVTTLNLHNSVTDASWMNEVMSHRLFRDAGVPAPRSSYARVYVTVPGKHDKEYVGLYSIVENVDSKFANERFGTKKGAIFKPVTPTPFEDMGDDWAKYKQPYDAKTDLTLEQQKRVMEFCKLVSKADDAEFAARVGDYLDVDEFARFMAVTTWVATLDSILGLGQNFLVYLDSKTQKFQFIPWDLDHSFGQFGMMGSQEQREQLSINKPWHRDVRFLQRVYSVPAFKKLYLAKLDEFSKTIFRPERFSKQVDEIAAAIRPAVKDESAEKLERFDKVVAGEPVSPATFGGGGGGSRGGQGGGRGGFGFFGDPPKPIKGFVTARAKSVNDQLAGKSEGQTVEGFGPRGPGGGGRGGRGGFGPGNFIGAPMFTALDADKDAQVTRAEVTAGFKKWFEKWNSDKSGSLNEEQLRAGINQDLTAGGGPFGGPPRGGPDRPQEPAK